jgi:hypothetical protein
MLPILAFRIQELSQGGLPSQTRAKLTETIGMLNASSRKVPRRFRPGTRIVREWKGKVHEVTITDGGFEYKGETFKSLSPIACRVTRDTLVGPGLLRYEGQEAMKTGRCAIYTRKSSEDGLDQSHLSLAHCQ